MLSFTEFLGNPVALAESLQRTKRVKTLVGSCTAAYRRWRSEAACRRERARGLLGEMRAATAAAASRHAGALSMTRRQHGTLGP